VQNEEGLKEGSLFVQKEGDFLRFSWRDLQSRQLTGLPGLPAHLHLPASLQSIQPGEGGWGLLGDAMAFRTVSKVSLYVNAAYLVTPQEHNGVTNGTSTSGPAQYMSVYDQYFLAGGGGFPIKGAASGGLAVRVEGVPAHDLVGGQFGFRRPGVAVSLQPSITIRRGKNSIDVAVPIAIYRNRFRSAVDELTPGRHGDAAFANWLLMTSITRKFQR
jgi:hypothetical protein